MASHVGYLEQGRLRFSEEMTTLVERFREVEVILDSPLAQKQAWPENWMQVDTSASVVRFIESRFDAERTPAEIRSRFQNVRGISFSPMSLRSIFLAMAKTGRNLAMERTT